MYIKDADDGLASGWEQIVAGAVTTSDSLDDGYNNGRVITADAGAVEINGSNTSETLTVVSNVSDGNAASTFRSIGAQQRMERY